MKQEWYDILCDPETKGALVYNGKKLINEQGMEYDIVDEIPILIKVTDFDKNCYALNLFKEKAVIYDEHQHLSFDTFYQDETQIRNMLIDKLCIKKECKVLELSAGTGRDSVLINKRLDNKSQLYVQDISMDMLKILKKKFDNSVYITQSNACALPYKDNLFDAVYSFAGVGMNTYADAKAIMQEIKRVAKVGAKVVIGGLSMAPWLYESDFAKILINHNSHYENKVDLSSLPNEARDVKLSWILNGAGFCLEFSIGEGEPAADFDFPIPGPRGGTLRTRYYGKLEGVSPEAKEAAMKAREKLDISMYDYLNKIIEESSRKILEEGKL